MDFEHDHYAALDLPPSASDDEIKRRYRRLMRTVHPDANATDPEATRKAARINAAFDTLGNAERRRLYDERRFGGNDRIYAAWAMEPDWEDIVAEHVQPRRPAHVHDVEPLIEPEEIEISVAELRSAARVRRRIAITNRCSCTIAGDVSTSEPWLWGPIGRLMIGGGESAEFDVEVVSRKVAFPGLSRVVFVARDWSGVVPVKISGFEARRRRAPPAAAMPYVRSRPQKWAKYR